jgi:uncharacterized membrane protein
MTKILDILLTLYLYFYLGLFITDYSFILSVLYKKFKFPLTAISNVTGPTIIFIFLLFLRWSLGRKSFSNSQFIRKIKKIDLDDKVLILLTFIVIFLILAILSIVRHFSLSSGASDLGIFDQAIWNTAQGDILFSSLKGNINLLGDHFEPILLLIGPLYKLWPNVIVLFILQSLLLASAIFPLYLIAKERLKERFLIFVFIISFILSKPLRGVGLSDFHPESFILPLLFWAYYFLVKRRNIPLFISIFFLLLCKEDVTFLVASLGIFALILQKRARLGISLFILGISLWFIETKIIIPHFNLPGNFMYMNRLPFGLTYMDNIKTIINKPTLLGNLFLNKAKVEYIIKLFGPVGFLSFLSPPHYILVAVPLLRNLMPVNPNFSGWYKVTSHYTASVVPFIYIAAIYGAGRLIDKIHHKKTSLFISLIIIFSSLMFYGKTDAYKFSRFLNTMTASHTLDKLSYLRLVPRNASVATNFNLVPHMSHRKYIFEWNPQAKTSSIVEYIVIDKSLLGYLSRDDVNKIEPYFNNIIKLGYKQIFSSPDKTFLIFHNPNIDKSLVEKVSLISQK